MRIIIYIIIFSSIFKTSTLTSQVNLGVQVSVSTLSVEAPHRNYQTGFKTGFGFVVFDEIKWFKNLSWETGINASFGQTGFYPLHRGRFIVINGNYPLNMTEKFLHRFWTLNVPIKFRYMAFDFIGILGKIEFSYLIDGNFYIPSISLVNRANIYRDITPMVEGGLFFPIGQRFIIEATAYKASEQRFYTALGQDINGNDVNMEGHSDYGFGIIVTYILR